jgi:hypothetical protein
MKTIEAFSDEYPEFPIGRREEKVAQIDFVFL